MSKKPKRIRAHHYYSDREGICYVIKQSDIRALAEQMAQDYWRSVGLKNDNHMLDALRRAGMTPGKGTQ